MGSLNRATLIGFLGKDPDVRSTQNGKKIVNLSLATSESWKDRESGERKERTEWHRVVIFNEGLADVAERYLKKGSQIYVDGPIRTRKWTDQAGVERYSTEICLEAFRGTLTMLNSVDGTRGSSSGSAGSSGTARSGDATRRPAEKSSEDSGRYSGDLDDEIPF